MQDTPQLFLSASRWHWPCSADATTDAPAKQTENLGVEAAFSDIGGWDTHQNQGAANGQLANRLTEFSNTIAAFWMDMGADAENVTLVTMSEFGRTARQNGLAAPTTDTRT